MLPSTRVLIAHANPLFVTMLHNILKAHPATAVVGHAINAASLLATATAVQPHIILCDIALPGIRRFALLRKLAAVCMHTKVIMHWCHGQEHLLAAAMKAGCDGGIALGARPPVYIAAIRDTMKGRSFYCDHSSRMMLPGGIVAVTQSLRKLNNTHRIVLFCMLMRFSAKETAIAANVTTSTVHTYRKLIRQMIGWPGMAAMLRMIEPM